MSEFDLANCIRLFKLEDNQSPEKPSPDYYAIIPVEETNVLQPVNPPKNDGEEIGYIKDWNYTFPEEGIDRLIEFRTELEDLFSDCGNILGIGAVLWKEISCRLFESGIDVSGRRCFDKWNSLYSEYLQMAMSDDEGKILNSKNFEKFEEIYKIRSSCINPRIESVNSMSTDKVFNIFVESKDSVKPHKDGKTEKDFTLQSEFTETSEENCQTNDYQALKQMITTAENLLDEDIKKEEDSKEEIKLDVVETQKPTCVNKRKPQLKIPAGSCYSRGKCKDEAKIRENDEPRCATAKNSPQNNVDGSFEKVKFCWDADSTQCLIDLRLHVESSSEVKKNIVVTYKSIAKFLSRKMRSNGWEISEENCKQKWTKLIRCYEKEAKNYRAKAVKNNEEVSVSKYFYEIDKVMKKSGRLRAADFTWSEASITTLIGIRIKTESAFSMFRKYIILWQYVATQMAKKNFFPTYNECSMKWIELREYYDFCFNIVKIGLLKKEEIGWKFFLDMYHAFKQNAETSKCVIEYPKVECSATESESFGTIKENVPVRSSIVPASVDVFETPTGKKLETLNGKECSEDRKARTEGAKRWLGRTEDTDVQSKITSDIIAPKTLLFESDERFVDIYNFYNASVLNSEEQRSQSKYSVESEAPKLLSSEKNAEAWSAGKSNADDSLEVKSRCVWDELMITILIELKFSKEIRDLKNYGQPISIRMHAAGYSDVTPSDCTRKWISLRKSYDRCLVRKITGKSITWQYFDLMNKHVENLVNEVELRIKNGNSSLAWLPDCVRDLFRHKLLHPEVFGETKPTNESDNSKDGNIPTGNNIKEIGKQPINFSCAQGKSKVDEEFGGGEVLKMLSTNTEHFQQETRVSRALNEDMEFGDEMAAIDLSMKVLGPCSEQNFVQNIAASDNSEAWRFDNHVDGAKENVRFFLDGNTEEPCPEKSFERRESRRSKIWCDNEPCNEIYSAVKAGNNQAEAYELNESQSLDRFKYDMPIQDGSLNSTQSFRITKKEKWNSVAMNLLTDLRIEHERKFPSGYSERFEFLWEKIAGQMTKMGYNFTSAECWQKWCSLKEIYEDKMADIKQNKSFQAWPYFEKFDSIYKKLEKIYKGFKRISPEKRKRDDDDDDEDGNELRGANLSSPKKLVISVLPSDSCCSRVSIPNTENDALEKNDACNCLKKTITWC